MQLCGIGHIDCVHARGLHGYFHYSLGQWSEYAGHPLSHSLVKVFILTDSYRMQDKDESKDLHSIP